MATTAHTTHSLLAALTYLLPYKTRRIARAAVAISSVASAAPTATTPAQHRSFRLTMPKRSTTAKLVIAPLRQPTPYPIDLPADPKLVQRLQARIAQLERDAEARCAPRFVTIQPITTTPAATMAIATGTPADDAVLAIQALGFPKQQAKRAVSAARTDNPTADTAALVKLALPQCGRVQASRFNSKKRLKNPLTPLP